MHNKAKLSQDNNEPEIVLQYNKTKGRVVRYNAPDDTRINPDPARTGEAEHLYHSKNTAACRDLSTKKDKER